VDDDDGLLYVVDKVYKHRGVIVADRYSFDGTQGVGRPETIHLLDILKYTIVQGKTNSKFQKPVTRNEDPLSQNKDSISSFKKVSNLLTSGKRVMVNGNERQTAKKMLKEIFGEV